MRITGNERLVLRTWEETDAEAAFGFYGDPEVSRYIGNGQPARDVEHVRAILRKFIDHQQRHGFSPWALADAPSGSIVGICGLHTFNEAGEPELGYRIHRRYWGLGIATEASRLAADFGQQALGMPLVSALSNPLNVASQRVLEKAGFARIGDCVADGFPAIRFERPTPEARP